MVILYSENSIDSTTLDRADLFYLANGEVEPMQRKPKQNLSPLAVRLQRRVGWR
jgi:hypothetical protein